MKVMTFNIRYLNRIDGINIWDNRKDLVAEVVKNYQPDILALQEATHTQMMDLGKRLAGYEWVGKGRNDGQEKGEYAPVFYDSTQFSVQEFKTIWLSETPEVPGSVSWDAGQTRIMTHVVFERLAHEDKFAFINTHYDNEGSYARFRSSQLIIQQANKVDDLPIIITGDFNCTEDTNEYKVLLSSGILHDSRYISILSPSGPLMTTNGFGKFNEEKAIDHIFVNNKMEINSHDTITYKPCDTYPSDHYPLLCDMDFIEAGNING